MVRNNVNTKSINMEKLESWKIVEKPQVFLGFSLIFGDFLVSEGSNIMKIRENSDKGGKEGLREQEDNANRALKATERGPEVPGRR